MYIEGMPPWLVARTFNVPNNALRSHAWRHNWCRRRSYNLPDPKYVVMLAVLGRLRDSWHLVSPNSADRMITLLMKLVDERSDR
jgi:hypothetical protein